MKTLLFFPTILLSLQTLAQNPVPNPGFENWYYTPFWTVEADGWISNNGDLLPWSVIPDSNAYTGTLALQLIDNAYPGTIVSGFPVNGHPDYLTGFVKNLMPSMDQATLSIVVYFSGIPVDSGSMIFYGGGTIGTYQPFSVPVSHTSLTGDSVVIQIIGGSILQSSISFDDLSIDDLSWIPDHPQLESNAFFYPNPVRGSLIIKYYDGTPYTATLIDASGQVIDVIRATGYSPLVETLIAVKDVEIDSKNLSAGIYFLHIRSEINEVTQRIIYEK